MILAKCPLRVSIAGGGTDLEDYISEHKCGHVISFACNLYTYASIHENNRNEYIINYSFPERAKDWRDIKNDLVRETLRRFNKGPVTITFNSDIYSSGSGLASSSSFCVSLVKAFNDFYNLGKSNIEICQIALEIERTFNPLTGRQDTYGCAIGGLKYLQFLSGCETPNITPLKNNIFKDFKMWLVPTKITRSSGNCLKKTTKSDLFPFFYCASELKKFILSNKTEEALKVISRGWSIKKENTPHVLNSEELKKIDDDFSKSPHIISHRLCGAGGGGYFFCITTPIVYLENAIEINIDEMGAQSFKI